MYVHTILLKAHILRKLNTSEHTILDSLVPLKIPVLSGIGASNNSKILEYLAANGASLKYDLFKNLKFARYSTVSRRIDDLRKRGYVAISGKRITERGKQKEESMYSLTWRGFVASLSCENVRKDIINTLIRNPMLRLPEKESIMVFLSEVATSEDLYVLSTALFESYLDVIPNLELINNDQLWTWLLAIRQRPKLPEGFKLSKMPEDALELLDRPNVLRVVKERIVPFFKERAVEIELVYRFFKSMGALGEVIDNLSETQKPSIQVRDFLEREFPKYFSDDANST
jgi:hypothetical protein